MNTDVLSSVRRFNTHPLGRVVLLVAGIVVVYSVLTLYPAMRTVVRWAFPVILFLWGASQIYYYGVSRRLTVIAASLLMLGGISRATFQLVPMSELTGAVANLVPFLGVIAEMYARHYRNRD